MENGACAACGGRLHARGMTDELWQAVRQQGQLLLDGFMRRCFVQHVAWLVVLHSVWSAAQSDWGALLERLLQMQHQPEHTCGVAAVLLLGLLTVNAMLTRPVNLCMVGAMRAGKTTIARFLASGLNVGPVFAPRPLGVYGGPRQQGMTVRVAPDGLGSAVALTDFGTLDGGPVGGGAVDASRLNAIRLGDDYGSAVLQDGADGRESEGDYGETGLTAASPSRWHAGAAALVPEGSPTPIWGLAGLTGVISMLLSGRPLCRAQSERAERGDQLDAADGLLFVVCRRQAASQQEEQWHAARELRWFREVCRTASQGPRPLLVISSKSDHASDDEGRCAVRSLCERLCIRHPVAGPRYFVHAASLPGRLYLPEEIRKRIYESALVGGAEDAACGRTLRLESGSALRVISGGVIGKASAARLLDGVAWLCKASGEAREMRTRRMRLATHRATLAVLLVWAVGLMPSLVVPLLVKVAEREL